VPDTVIKRRFATEIRKEVIDSLLPERFNKAVVDLGVRPVGEPRVSELTVEDGAPLHVKAVFEFIPDFSIEGYQSVAVDKRRWRLPKRSSSARWSNCASRGPRSRPVEEDRLWGRRLGADRLHGPIEGDAEAAPIVGQDSLVEIGGKDTVEAFSTALRGAKAGQELKAEVIYPPSTPSPSWPARP